MKRSEENTHERQRTLGVQAILLLVVAIGVISFVLLGKSGGEGMVESRDARQERGDRQTQNGRQAGEAMAGAREVESFPFDPNTADSLTLVRLGLTPYQVRNIYKYRAKGGRYHRPEEFKKLYGLTVEQWQHLQPLIRIGEQFRYLAETDEAYDPQTDGYPRRNGYRDDRTFDEGHAGGNHADEAHGGRADGSDRHPYEGGRRDTSLYPKKLNAGQTVDLNTADTTALKRIPGIGSYFARQIVQYREKLGGFVSMRQLDELEKLPLGIEKYLVLGNASPRRIMINKASFRELNGHPYISYYQARAISNHIHQFGPVHSFRDLSLYEEFTQQDFKRLEPYIDFTE